MAATGTSERRDYLVKVCQFGIRVIYRENWLPQGTSQHDEHDNRVRAPTDHERRIIAKLIDPLVAVRKVLLQQLATVRVKQIDDDGSLELRTDPDATAVSLVHRVPVEAEVKDIDGTTVVVALHVVEGRLAELEIYRADGRDVTASVDPDTFSIVTMDGDR
jgi:hypothetical protein